MSTSKSASKEEHKVKKLGKGERSVPHHTQKAKKFYPAEDEAKPKKVCGTLCTHEYRWDTVVLRNLDWKHSSGLDDHILPLCNKPRDTHLVPKSFAT